MVKHEKHDKYLFEFGGFALVEPGGQLDYPNPKVGIIDVEVVGDTPHYDQVHLRVKEKYESLENEKSTRKYILPLAPPAPKPEFRMFQ